MDCPCFNSNITNICGCSECCSESTCQVSISMNQVRIWFQFWLTSNYGDATLWIDKQHAKSPTKQHGWVINAGADWEWNNARSFLRNVVLLFVGQLRTLDHPSVLRSNSIMKMSQKANIFVVFLLSKNNHNNCIFIHQTIPRIWISSRSFCNWFVGICWQVRMEIPFWGWKTTNQRMDKRKKNLVNIQIKNVSAFSMRKF